MIEEEMAEIFFRKKTCSMVETLKIVGPIFTGALKPPSQTERTGEGAQIIDLLVNSYGIKVRSKSLGLLLQIETYHRMLR
jgi:hypothetical protein